MAEYGRLWAQFRFWSGLPGWAIYILLISAVLLAVANLIVWISEGNTIFGFLREHRSPEFGWVLLLCLPLPRSSILPRGSDRIAPPVP
jgi:hypothetical protein